jgi:general secretion pathway protein D
VPHEPTNSLLIQAEPEEYDEILNILSKIDTKRRQVFIEAALVQVSSASNLNYTIELLAGNPDDKATRALVASSFNLTGIDFQNFQRTIPDIQDPAAVPPGGLLAIMNRGKLPAIVRFFKSNRDSQVLATPFVLADDNKENVIEIKETRFVQTTNTVNTATTTSQQGEDAGIRLSIFPTISSQQAVLLQMELEVSEFAEALAAASTLPPKSSNTITSEVTIPDGEVFVVGGLTRLSKSKSVSKVPILGDIPILGKLFRSESTAQSQNNLYMFLQAHILTDEEFRDGVDLTNQAMEKVHAMDPSMQAVQFKAPNVEKRAPNRDEDAERFRNVNESRGNVRDRNRRSSSPGLRMDLRPDRRGRKDDSYQQSDSAEPEADDTGAPAARVGGSQPPPRRIPSPGKTAPPSKVDLEDHDGWLLSPAPASARPAAPSEGDDR